MATALPPSSSSDSPRADKQYRKPRADLYTLMLAVSLVAILVGIVFLCLYNGIYDWKMKDASVNAGMIMPPAFLSMFFR